MLELHIVQVINGHSGKKCIRSTLFTSVKTGVSFSKLKGTAFIISHLNALFLRVIFDSYRCVIVEFSKSTCWSVVGFRISYHPALHASLGFDSLYFVFD